MPKAVFGPRLTRISPWPYSLRPGMLRNESREGIILATYVISEVEIVNEAAANRYKQLAAASIAAHGGRYLARGVEAAVVEGEPTQRKIVIVEFPSMQQLRKWYASAEYAEALKYRGTALERRLMFVEGENPRPDLEHDSRGTGPKILSM